MNAPRISPRRLFLLFTVGLIVPSAFLIYLGLTSIRAEKRLLEKESAERLGATADALVEQLNQNIRLLAVPVLSTLQNPSLDRRVLTQLLEAQRPAWQSLIVLDAASRVFYPYRETLPDVQPMPALSDAFQSRLDAAETHEFTANDYAAAAQGYRALMADVPSSRWQASLTLRLAGSRMKAKAWSEAEDIYRTVLSRFPVERNEQGFPFSLLASVQIGDLLTSAGRRSEAIENDLKLLQDIGTGRWPLPVSDEQFFIRRVSDRLNRMASGMTPAQQSHWGRLSRDTLQRRQSAERLQDWLRQEWPAAQLQLRQQGRSERPTVIWPPTSAHALLVVPVVESGHAQRLWTAVVTLDPRVMTAAWKTTLETVTTAGGLSYRLQTEGSRPQVILSTASVPAIHEVRRVDGIIPALELQMGSGGLSATDQFAERRRLIYLAMVGLAALVIGVALVVTWWAVSREMEVAQLKARFVASMSHELKTPLSIIDLVGQKLKLGRYSTNEEAQEYYAMLSDETTRLKGLIEDVLDFSRVMENRTPFVLIPMDWVLLIRETLARFAASEAGKDLTIPFETTVDTCPIRGDAAALSRVLLNLLENARKYSPPDRLSIRVRLQTQDGHAVLSVSDQGYGISPDEKKLIFDRFYRGQSASQDRPIPGAGLGLSIVQHIVQAHGGTVDVDSDGIHGSVFRVRLPLV